MIANLVIDLTQNKINTCNKKMFGDYMTICCMTVTVTHKRMIVYYSQVTQKVSASVKYSVRAPVHCLAILPIGDIPSFDIT